MRKPIGAPLDLDYFFSRSIPEPNSGCWLWMGAVARNGYGVISKDGGTQRAHRIVFCVANNTDMPSSVDICHTCDIRSCVNPSHLFAGTRTDNMRDCANKGRIRLPNLSGEKCPASKLRPDQVLVIREDGRSNRAIAREYGVDKGTISNIKRGLTWRSL